MIHDVTGGQSESKKQRSPRGRKTKSEWQLNQRQFDQNRSQEISHISPREQVNVFNTEEPSVSYLQLPTRKENNRLCTRCGEIGHWRRYCQVTTWCKFCMSETHATQACRRYANFIRDNPIASSRRMTPVQEHKRSVQSDPSHTNVHQRQQPKETDQRQLFPHLPTSTFPTSGCPTSGNKKCTTLTTMIEK